MPDWISELIERTQLPRISFRLSTPRAVNSDSRPGLLWLKRHLGTSPYILNGGFVVFRDAFPHFTKYRMYPTLQIIMQNRVSQQFQEEILRLMI